MNTLKTLEQQNDFNDLSQKLLTTTNGSEYHDAVHQLVKKFGVKMHRETLQTLVQAVNKSPITHARDFVIARISELVTEDDTEMASFFYEMINCDLPYWTFDGLLKVEGAKCYPFLLDYLQKETDEENAAKAILALAEYTHQPFNYDLPSDPAYWEELPIDKLLQWQAEGYPQGTPLSEFSYLVTNSQTEMEHTIAKIEKRLAKDRSLWRPNSYEYNRAILEVPQKQVIEEIKQRWQLPAAYLHFLEHYSPKATIFLKGIDLYGANTLIEHQEGYAFDTPEGERFPDWNPVWVVIADKDADPYILDLSKSDGSEAPIYKAPHGEGTWKFRKVADSFQTFLQKLA